MRAVAPTTTAAAGAWAGEEGYLIDLVQRASSRHAPAAAFAPPPSPGGGGDGVEEGATVPAQVPAKQPSRRRHARDGWIRATMSHERLVTLLDLPLLPAPQSTKSQGPAVLADARASEQQQPSEQCASMPPRPRPRRKAPSKARSGATTTTSNALPRQYTTSLGEEEQLFQRAVEEYQCAAQRDKGAGIPFSGPRKRDTHLDLDAFIQRQQQERMGFLPSLASYVLPDFPAPEPMERLDPETTGAFALRVRYGANVQPPVLRRFGIPDPKHLNHRVPSVPGLFNLHEPDWLDLRVAMARLAFTERTHGREVEEVLAREQVRAERTRRVWRQKISRKFQRMRQQLELGKGQAAMLQQPA